MPVKARLEATFDGSSEPRVLELVLSDDDAALLRAFLEYAEEMETCRFLRAGLEAKVALEWHREKGLTYRVELPPLDDVAALLHRLRPLILKREHASFERTRGLLGRHLDDPAYRAILKFIGYRYSGKHMQSMIQIRSNNEMLNSEDILFAWLNAFEYHREVSKQEFLQELHAILPLDFSKAIWLQLLLDKVLGIRELAAVVRLVLGVERTLHVRI